MKRLILITSLILMTVSCSTYSTARRPETENLINAPIDTVWARTLEILPTERMTLQTISKEDYFIAAKKSITFWSWGDEVSIRLIPQGEEQTIMEFSSGNKAGWGDLGHQGRMVTNIFDRIKRASENSPSLK
jgi:hypothetical protein